MKKIQIQLLTLLFIMLTFSTIGTSQDDLTFELNYEMDLVYPPLSIPKTQRDKAESIVDLNKHFKSSWIKEYKSVEVSTIQNGIKKKSIGKNNVLTQEQKDMMKSADTGTETLIKVRYIPDNTLKHNDVKEFKFSFLVHPENKAKYIGGEKELKKYLKEKVMDNIPDDIFRQYQVAIVKFIVDEEGQINSPKLFWTSKDENFDELMLETVREMPKWKPAEYEDGTKTKQEVAFTVGDRRSCAMNTLNLNIRRE